MVSCSLTVSSPRLWALALTLMGTACSLSDTVAVPFFPQLSITSPAHGSIGGADSGTVYRYRETVTLTAIPRDATYRVLGWTGAAATCGQAVSCQITMDADKTVGVDIGKRPVGFGRDVTGGLGGEVVAVTTGQELAAALCQTVANGVCTDTTPRVIHLSTLIDFRTTMGTATSQGCNYSDNACSVSGATEQILNQQTFCSGKTLFSISYDAAGTSPMLVGSNKTVLGIGTQAGWKGRGLLVKDGHSNIIIRNLSITDINEGLVWAGDGIGLNNASRVWIDHDYLARLGRMMIVTGYGAAPNVTISNTYFDGRTVCGHYCDGRHYWNALLAGAGQSITLWGNYFHAFAGDAPQLGNPGPDASGGVVHLVNNYFDDANRYAVVPATRVVALLEGNVFADTPGFIPIAPTGSDGGYPVFAPLEADIATAETSCQAALGRACAGNRATTGLGNFIMDATVMPAIRANPASASAMGSVTPLRTDDVPNRVRGAAGPQSDPDD